MRIIGHEYRDDNLKTDESYRVIPIAPRLKDMLVKFKNEKMEICKKSGKKWNESDYVFLNTEGTPYVP